MLVSNTGWPATGHVSPELAARGFLVDLCLEKLCKWLRQILHTMLPAMVGCPASPETLPVNWPVPCNPSPGAWRSLTGLRWKAEVKSAWPTMVKRKPALGRAGCIVGVSAAVLPPLAVDVFFIYFFFVLCRLKIYSKYGIVTYICWISMVNLGKYTIHFWVFGFFPFLSFPKQIAENNSAPSATLSITRTAWDRWGIFTKHFRYLSL